MRFFCFVFDLLYLVLIIGAWLSVHIDDLRDTHDMSLDLSVLCGTPISKLLALPTKSGTKLWTKCKIKCSYVDVKHFLGYYGYTWLSW